MHGRDAQDPAPILVTGLSAARADVHGHGGGGPDRQAPLSGASAFWERSGFPAVAGQPVAVIAVSPSASRRRVAASWLRAVSGIPAGSLPPFAARPAAPPMYRAARRSNAGGNGICAGSPACSAAASAVI